jgi:hypothetical protein
MRARKAKRGWRVPALLGLLCLLAPAGLSAPAVSVFIFMFFLFVLMIFAEPA